MDTTSTTPTVSINAFPTPKEQIVNGAIGLAFTAASVIVVVGAFSLVGKVAEYKQSRAAKKQAKKNQENTTFQESK